MTQQNIEHDKYLTSIERLEANVVSLDKHVTLASITISLKRIADAMDFVLRPIKEE